MTSSFRRHQKTTSRKSVLRLQRRFHIESESDEEPNWVIFESSLARRSDNSFCFSFLFFLCNLTSQLLWAWNWDIPGWVVTLIYLHVLLFLLCFAVFYFPPRHRTHSIVFKNSLAIATALSTAHEKSQWDTKAAACLKINLKTDLLLLKVNKNDIFFYWFLLSSLPIIAWLSSPCAVSGRWQRSRSVSIYTERKIHCCLFLLSFM